MPATIYYDNDADLSLLKGKTIAILGYGSQGHAQAQNLRDSGCNVVVGQRPGGPNYDLAVKHGFKPVSLEDATKQGDLVKAGAILMASHGFNFHFGQVEPPPGHDIMLVAPKGPGHLVRSEFEKGGGVPSLIAVGEGSKPETLKYGHSNHDRRRNRNRPVRRAGGAVRRRERAGEVGLPGARRRRLPAGDGLLRVPA
jgi:ketol-acid reductoisomerase